jgi:hypothetical protein
MATRCPPAGLLGLLAPAAHAAGLLGLLATAAHAAPLSACVGKTLLVAYPVSLNRTAAAAFCRQRHGLGAGLADLRNATELQGAITLLKAQQVGALAT